MSSENQPFGVGGYIISKDIVLQPVPTIAMQPYADSSRVNESCGELGEGAVGHRYGGYYLPPDHIGWNFDDVPPCADTTAVSRG